MTQHTAPWSKTLIAVSTFATMLLVAVAAINWHYLRDVPWVGYFAIGATGLILGASLLFTVRGYRLDGGNLYVLRLMWETAVDLRDLDSVQVDPGAMSGSIRLFGNGGLFSFTGIYRNKRLGRYRAFVTDHRRAVVLALGGKNVVVSPGDPRRFVADILMNHTQAHEIESISTEEAK